MAEILLAALLVLNQILNAGNAITAFSLLLYSLTFNLRERVAQSFALLLACVTIVFFADVLTGTVETLAEAELWLRLQWVGISFIPATYLHLSDSLLAATGRPSRGRRRRVVQLSYVISGALLLAAAFTPWIGEDVLQTDSIEFLSPGPLFPVFLIYLIASLAVAGLNFWRAYRRCLTRESRRRMAYLMIGSAGPILGSVPALMISGPFLASIPMAFWSAVLTINAAVAALLVIMAYPIAYFGVSYPDRIVKSRLFQWILRGPVVASTVLALTVVVNRVNQLLGIENSRAVLFSMVAGLLVLQYLITLIRPVVERWLFYGTDRQEIARLQLLEERLLTTGDLRQYLEYILNAVSDLSGSGSAFVALVGPEGLELEVSVGPHDPLRGSEELPTMVMSEDQTTIDPLGSVFRWDSYWLVPLHSPDSADLIGLLGMYANDAELSVAPEIAASLAILADRAAVALSDRMLQREVFTVVDRLVPEVEEIHHLRAAARYQGAEALAGPFDGVSTQADLAALVKDALGHYWGGPRLSRSPLLGLRVVRQAMVEHDGNPINALRQILRDAINRVRPAGERGLTAEWMLYNILEMKFLEGRKVRDVALRLAMSEADLYRKQRVAIEMVAQAIADMERDAVLQAPAKEPATR